MLAAGLGTYMTVHLLIRGERTVVVPDLMGREVVYALEVLTDLGLNTKVRGSEFNPDIPRHHIIDQDPEPGSEIKKGRDVRLVISKGPRNVIVPNLIGMSLPMAKILLAENDLAVGTQSRVFHPSPQDQLVAQYPPPGKHGLRGESITLLVSDGPSPRWIPMAALRYMTLDQAIEVIESHQLTMGTITQINDPNRPDNVVTAHTPPPGHPVLPGSTIDLTVNRREKITTSGSDRTSLFRYRSPEGFLRQHVRVRISRFDGSFDIMNRFVSPGEEIWLLILRDVPTTLFLYIDDDLHQTIQYQ